MWVCSVGPVLQAVCIAVRSPQLPSQLLAGQKIATSSRGTTCFIALNNFLLYSLQYMLLAVLTLDAA